MWNEADRPLISELVTARQQGFDALRAWYRDTTGDMDSLRREHFLDRCVGTILRLLIEDESATPDETHDAIEVIRALHRENHEILTRNSRLAYYKRMGMC